MGSKVGGSGVGGWVEGLGLRVSECRVRYIHATESQLPPRYTQHTQATGVDGHAAASDCVGTVPGSRWLFSSSLLSLQVLQGP